MKTLCVYVRVEREWRSPMYRAYILVFDSGPSAVRRLGIKGSPEGRGRTPTAAATDLNRRALEEFGVWLEATRLRR